MVLSLATPPPAPTWQILKTSKYTYQAWLSIPDHTHVKLYRDQVSVGDWLCLEHRSSKILEDGLRDENAYSTLGSGDLLLDLIGASMDSGRFTSLKVKNYLFLMFDANTV